MNKVIKYSLSVLIITVILIVVYSITKTNTKAKNKNNTQKIDSVSFLINSATTNPSDSLKKIFLIQAKQSNLEQSNDSIKLDNMQKIASEAYALKDSLFFRSTNDEAILFSKKKNNLFGLADAHWNYGNFFLDNEANDSAYFHYQKAYNYFNTIKHDYYSAKMLYNMAIILCDINDFTQSELLTFKAIAIFKKEKRWLNLYRCYCNLGVIYSGIEDFERAIYYNNKSLEYLDKVDAKVTSDQVFREISLNNIGVIYEKNKEYSKAVDYFEKALDNDSLIIKDIHLYAMLKDNLAYNKFLEGDKENTEKELNESLRLRDSINHIAGIIVNKEHLANYYLSLKDTTKALLNAKQAISLAYKSNYNRDKLNLLLLLSKIDKNKSKLHLTNYIKLNDSIQKSDRKIRNKFYRISFETDEYIEEAKKLQSQKKTIIIFSAALLLIVFLLYYSRIQFSKNKELLFEQEQKLANEEIYRLMLIQQAKLEEGKMQERQRISEELHDGVLCKLFGTRMGLSFLEIQGDTETTLKQKSYINNLVQIESEIRSISHELKNDVISFKDNFIKIVENLLQSQSTVGNFKYSIVNDYNIYWDEVDERIKINIYRIIQESLNNFIKHAKAKKIHISFELQEDLLVFVIQDDGIGFLINKRSKGIGLKNMNSRVEAMGGFFSINSEVKKGTIINITIPIKYNKNED